MKINNSTQAIDIAGVFLQATSNVTYGHIPNKTAFISILLKNNPGLDFSNLLFPMEPHFVYFHLFRPILQGEIIAARVQIINLIWFLPLYYINFLVEQNLTSCKNFQCRRTDHELDMLEIDS